MGRNVLSKVIPSQDSHLVHILFALIASNPNRFHLRQLYSMCKPTMKRNKFKNKINTLKMFISAKTHCVVAVITRVITSKYAFSADEFYACSFANSTRHNNFLMYSCNSEFYGVEIFFPLFFEMILVKEKLLQYFLPPTKTPYFLWLPFYHCVLISNCFKFYLKKDEKRKDNRILRRNYLNPLDYYSKNNTDEVACENSSLQPPWKTHLNSYSVSTTIDHFQVVQ